MREIIIFVLGMIFAYLLFALIYALIECIREEHLND